MHRQESVIAYTKELNKQFRFKTFLFADSHGNCLRRDAESFKIHNLAYGSDSYKDILRKLEYLIHNNVDIDTLIITVDPHTLSPYREAVNNDQYSSLLRDQVDMYLPILNAQYTTTLPRLAEMKTKSLLTKKNVKKTTSTWADLSISERVKAANGRFRSQFPRKGYSSNLRKDLMKILDRCKEFKIVVYGIRFPLVAEYSAMVDREDYGASKIFDHKQIPVLNYQNQSFPDTNFKNQDHLNLEGGFELLKLIKRDLSKPTHISTDGL
jgi:hypothetical protein